MVARAPSNDGAPCGRAAGAAMRDGIMGLAVAVAIALGAAPAAAQEADLAALRAAAKASPSDPAASLALGKALRRAGRFDEAALELARGAGMGAAPKAGLAGALRLEQAR